MHLPFYKKIEHLQEKIELCDSREDISSLAQALKIDLLVKYNTNSFFSFTENLSKHTSSGSLSFSIETEIVDGENKIDGRPISFYISQPNITKKELERKYVETIIQTLKHLDPEDYRNE